MSFAQCINIAKGYHKRKQKELEVYVAVMREPYALIYNMFAEKGSQKKPKELFPLEGDSTQEKEKIYIPAQVWMNIFKNTFNGQ